MEPTGFVSSTAKNLTQFSAQLEIFFENVLEVEVDRWSFRYDYRTYKGTISENDY